MLSKELNGGCEQDIYDFHDVTEGSVLGVQDLFTHIGMCRKVIMLPLSGKIEISRQVD